MNEMYNMGIVTHYYGVMTVLAGILINLFRIKKATTIQSYRKFNILFNPINGTFVGTVVFTGVIMMAAKHLDFTIENIFMIIISLFIIVLEVKRSKRLKFLLNDNIEGFVEYKQYGSKLLIYELISVVLISTWMLVI